MGHSMLPISRGLVLSVALSGLAGASQLVGWWGGTWTCDIDGRPARMKWIVVEPGVNMCDDQGRNCVMNHELRWQGGFADNGSRWVSLTQPRLGDKGGMFFHHADGNRWYLAKPKGERTTGWTTWNGQRYRLSCWR